MLVRDWKKKVCLERKCGVKNELQHAPILTFGCLSVHAD